MGVSYASNAIIPAPFVNISKEYQTNDDGERVGTVFNITLIGTLISYKGSPNSSGVLHTGGGYPADETLADDANFPSILRKQEAIRTLFATEGQVLSIQPYNGAAAITCNPRVKRINIPDGPWYNKCPFTIELEADVLYVSGTAVYEDTGDFQTYKISKASEEWQIEPADDKFITYRLSRTLSAVGKRHYNSSGSLVQAAYLNAKDYVINKMQLGIDMTKVTSSKLNLAGTAAAYNYARSENHNQKAGIYSVTETWLIYDPAGNAAGIDEFVVDTRTEDSGKVTVVVNGTITGLQISNNTTQVVSSTKYTNAAAKFTEIEGSILTRAQNYSGVTINTTILNKVVTRNVQAGVITYSYTYDNRPSTTINGAVSEIISVNFVNPVDVIAIIPVLARPAGPIIQDTLSNTHRVKTVTIEAMMPAKTQSYSNETKPNTDSVVAGFIPGGSQVYTSQDVEDWTPATGRYRRVYSWTWLS